ncbi:MAG: hypothetical protein ACRELY_22260, partial [Polyangiaceae bacterium]
PPPQARFWHAVAVATTCSMHAPASTSLTTFMQQASPVSVLQSAGRPQRQCVPAVMSHVELWLMQIEASGSAQQALVSPLSGWIAHLCGVVRTGQ